MKFISITKEHIWHDHFTPSIIAALVVALITAFMELTVTNVVLFSSLAASAFILTNVHSHHLTKLHTTLKAYIIAIAMSIVIYTIAKIIYIPFEAQVFILIFLVAILLYILRAVHPPAVSASFSFLLFDAKLDTLIYLFISIIVLLVLVRLVTYLFSQHLDLKEFWNEFKKQVKHNGHHKHH